MKILIASGSFKGTLKSVVANEIIANALRATRPDSQIEKLALADGGEGTLEAFDIHFGCEMQSSVVRGPLGNPVNANFGLMTNSSAIIETSQAIGLSHIAPEKRNPCMASSFGAGELVRHAVSCGAKQIFVTMGDSATMDMGLGMLKALGVRFFSKHGEIVSPVLNDLSSIVEFDDREIQPLRRKISFTGLADTDDYLCGEIGQVQLFGKQKGLSESQIPVIEQAYSHFAAVIERQLGVDVTQVIRASGSGGLGAALYAFLGAKLFNTLEYLSSVKNFDESFEHADYVITGEGLLDNQTCLGKVPHFVATRTAGHCIAIVGGYTEEGIVNYRNACKRGTVFCLNPLTSISNPRDALYDAATSIFSLAS